MSDDFRDDDLQDMLEHSYLDGERSAYRRIIGELMRGQLAAGDTAETWRLERMDAIAKLRILCADFGDNDWPDNLNLGDILDKHLGRHLYEWEDES